MTFNVLLFKNANYQQIKERALLYDKHGQNYYLCTSKKGFRKAICVNITNKTKNPQLGLLYSAKHFALHH